MRPFSIYEGTAHAAVAADRLAGFASAVDYADPGTLASLAQWIAVERDAAEGAAEDSTAAFFDAALRYVESARAERESD